MSIKDAVQAGDVPKAVEVLKTVLRDKPKENRWSEFNTNKEELSTRAFYETGG
jgi:cyclic pyranopterin phosphate synthase